MIGGPKLTNFKIGGQKLQNGENRRSKTAIKRCYIWYIFTSTIVFSGLLSFSNSSYPEV
jgi:hypothetical protein